MKRWLFIAVVFTLVGALAAQHEDPHEHEQALVDPFHSVVEYMDALEEAGHGERNITLSEMNDIISILFDRVQCSQMDFSDAPTNCTECLSAESLFTIVGADTLLGLSEEGFGQASVILLLYLSDLQTVCKDIAEPSAKDYTYFEEQVLNYGDASTPTVLTLGEFESILEDVNQTYKAENFAKCFTDHTIYEDDVHMENYSTGADPHETESVAAVTISYLLQGYCNGEPTEVDPDNFVHNIFELYGENGIISYDAYGRMLEKMNIGHGESGHSDGGHIHKRSVTTDTFRSLPYPGQVQPGQWRSSRSKRAAEDNHDHSLSVEECFDGDEILHIYDVDMTLGIDEKTFIEMCPSFVQQIVSDACVVAAEIVTPASWQMYLWGTLTVLLISLLAILGILVIPLANEKAYDIVMQTLTALAVGTMTTDAMLHLIPHSLDLHGHTDAASHEGEDLTFLWKMTVVMASIYCFFVLERTMTLISQRFSKRKISGDEGEVFTHGHSHTMKPQTSEKINGNANEMTASASKTHLTEAEQSDTVENGNAHVVEDDNKKKSSFFKLNSVAVMIIVGDAFHNMADGMAIGAAFCIDAASGISTAIAVLCHELPHELGDFAMLVSTGLSYKVALGWNFFCACCGFIGLYIGLAVGSVEGASSWILAMTAGMFLYVALVDMMPELMRPHRQRQWTIFIFQNIGFLVGFTIILLLSLFEDKIRITTGM